MDKRSGSDPQVTKLVADHDLDALTRRGGPGRAALAARPGAGPALLALGADGSQPHALRFKAYEALIALGQPIAEPADRRSAALVYAEEIATGDSHNYWGMPDALDRPARTLIGLGRDAALPALAPLFGNQRALVYEGSEEPAISEHRGYRVADLAGAIAAVLLDRPFPAADPDPARRDAALRSLANAAGP